MRKYALALAALIGLINPSNSAYFQGQTYLGPTVPQITCDLATGVASVGGPCTVPTGLQTVCSDNSQVITRNVTMVTSTGGSPPANRRLNVSVPTFASTDVGKYIIVPGASGGAGNLQTTITAFEDSQNVILAIGALTAIPGTATQLSYGADDAPYFKQFNTWAQANQGSTNQVVLTLPSNGSCWFGSTQFISASGGGNNLYWAGLNNVVTEGNGTTLTSENNGSGFDFSSGSQCHRGLTNASGCSARIKTVSAGSSTIELTAASYAAGYISRFSATPGTQGNWILIGGIDTQSLWQSTYGYPSNPVYFEWRQVVAICNNTGPCTGTATLTLDRPLTYTLLDTWPEYNSGSSGEADPGGPATIWGYPSGWNSTAEFKNITVKQVNQTNTNRRNVTIRNIITGSTSGADVIPSQNEDFKSYGGTFVHIEVDKVIQSALYDGATISIMKCQSNSVVNMTIRNSTFSNQLTGCGRNTYASDSTFNLLSPGTYSYGGSTKFVCTRCKVTTFSYTGGIGQVGSNWTDANYTMSGGVIQFPNTSASGSATAQRIFGPLPNNLFWMVGGSFGGSIGLVRPQNLTQDATNTYSQTNESGGFPAWAGGLTGVRTHPAPQFTNDDPDLTSDPVFIATSVQNGATALAPLCEHGSKTYTPSATGAQSKICAMGKIVSLTIDVQVAGTTASGNLTMNPTHQFHAETVKQSDWSVYDWVPVINLKQAGTRVITPSGTTCNGVAGPGPGGSCSGDTCNLPASGCYTLPEAVWFKDNITPFVSAGGTVTGTPTVRVSIQTDQGVVP